MAKQLEKQIEVALMAFFPGLKVRFTVDNDGSWDFKILKGSKERFDEKYPGMTRDQADAQILEDIKSIIQLYMPDTEFIGYERYGKYSRFNHESITS